MAYEVFWKDVLVIIQQKLVLKPSETLLYK